MEGSVDGEEVRVIDWESWHISTATMDLAHMMAMHWYPDRRNRMERLLLAATLMRSSYVRA